MTRSRMARQKNLAQQVCQSFQRRKGKEGKEGRKGRVARGEQEEAA